MQLALLMRRACLASALALSLLASAVATAADGWVQPTTADDPESLWDFESDAFDGNGATYAQDTSNRVGDGAWLEFSLAAPIRTDRVRIQADFGYGAVDAVSVEVRSDGAWVPAFTGEVGNAAPTIVAIAPQVINGLRFRFHYTTTGYWFWLYEIAAYQLGDAITTPRVTTLAPTSVWPEAAVLHAQVAVAGGEPAEVRFEYGPTTAYGASTPWTPGHASGDTVAARVPSGLTAGTTWHVHVQARNSAGSVDGDDVAFTPGPVTATTWMSPTTVVSSGWDNADGALDDDPATSARSFHDLYSAEWSPWLATTLPPSSATGVRFAAARGAEVDGLQIDVHLDGAWQTVRTGDFADVAVTEVPFAAALVDSVRARMHMRRPEVGQYWDLYQLQVRVEPSTAVNQAPVVSAGPDISGVVGDAITLAGSATDDGLPSGSTLAIAWDTVSGPGSVTFASAASAATTATFSAPGTYVVRLTASDGVLSSSATATVTVVSTSSNCLHRSSRPGPGTAARSMSMESFPTVTSSRR